MKSTASITSHPIHPMLIPFPFAFLAGAWGFRVAARDENAGGTTRLYLT
jgi:uncharacterized membrane protein